MLPSSVSSCFFFFNDTATTEIYTLSLHDALPICHLDHVRLFFAGKIDVQDIPLFGRLLREGVVTDPRYVPAWAREDRKSTRLNSSHQIISYAVFCLKKKKKRSDTHRSSVVR